MTDFLSRFANQQYQHICKGYWEELLPCIPQIANPESKYYRIEDTQQWLKDSVAKGIRLAKLALNERAYRFR